MTEPNQTSNGQFGRQDNGEAGGRFIPQSANEALRPEKVPSPPKRSREARSQLVIFLNFVMSMITLATVGAVALVYYAFHEYQARGPLETNTTFLVREGAGVKEIASALERRNIISQARIFQSVTSFLGAGEAMRHGEYEIKAGASMEEVMELFRSGKSIQYSITFPEGLTVKQIFKRLAADPVLEGELPVDLPPEGSLRPDTYKFTRGSDRKAILQQMQASQAKLIDQVWKHRDSDLPIETKEQLLVLASIVEKETGKADERPQVASVFLNRLRKNMRLQSDPTIIYGVYGGDGKPADKPITQSDKTKETPYNTYVIKGLPPTPIANPGRAALEAVANPSKTDYLYFVADGTGGHAFAKTLDDHNANVRRWRQIEAEAAKQKAAGGEADADPNAAQDAN
ncbi:endolytic transglycosylase MltG [Rhizobium sp. FKL33]|uniref:endolytic transglycosylase MltG n=1 Tax=Rhizobium sp. FKL33 TaxID=2562307 RepID=UPI0010C0C797|nr:endolytic transglycosylase MltG [Rhizobium sp. FKL33]